jgi:hypothetical protein
VGSRSGDEDIKGMVAGDEEEGDLCPNAMCSKQNLVFTVGAGQNSTWWHDPDQATVEECPRDKFPNLFLPFFVNLSNTLLVNIL